MRARTSCFTLAIALLTVSLPALADTTFYTTDFENGVDPVWSRTELVTRDSGSFLGNFGAESATLSLNALPAHGHVTIDFDLLIIATWDGNLFDGVGPDIFRIRVDGTSVLQTTFSNVGGSPQSYPDPYPDGDHPAFSGNDGFVPGIFGSDVVRYRVHVVVPHTAGALQVTWSASGLQELSDESWGLDHVRVVLDADDDRDGIDDDLEPALCRGSAPGAPTTAVGCDVDQACPCDAPHGRVAWESLGEYRRCVGRTLDEMVAAGRVAKSAARALRRARLESGCARPR